MTMIPRLLLHMKNSCTHISINSYPHILHLEATIQHHYWMSWHLGCMRCNLLRWHMYNWRERRLVKWDKQFTNPSSKLFKVSDPCQVDPLNPYDKDQFKSFNKCYTGVVDNSMPIELKVGTGYVSWFLDLKTLEIWIDGKVRFYILYTHIFNCTQFQKWSIYFNTKSCFLLHIDTAFHLIQEQVCNFPKTYGEKITIEDSIIDQFFACQYDKFKAKRVKAQYKFNESF